jgi:hypothetical protein
MGLTSARFMALTVGEWNIHVVAYFTRMRRWEDSLARLLTPVVQAWSSERVDTEKNLLGRRFVGNEPSN